MRILIIYPPDENTIQEYPDENRAGFIEVAVRSQQFPHTRYFRAEFVQRSSLIVNHEEFYF